MTEPITRLCTMLRHVAQFRAAQADRNPGDGTAAVTAHSLRQIAGAIERGGMAADVMAKASAVLATPAGVARAYSIATNNPPDHPEEFLRQVAGRTPAKQAVGDGRRLAEMAQQGMIDPTTARMQGFTHRR